jgi:DinB family protein
MTSDIHRLIDRFEEAITALEDAVRGVRPDLLDRAPAPGKWTIRQIAAHNADFDVVNAARLRWLIAQPDKLIVSWDQDIWAGKLHYEKQPLEDALAAFRSARRYTAQMLRQQPDSVWQHTARHEEKGEIKILDVLAYAGEHAERHAAQIRAIRQKFGG